MTDRTNLGQLLLDRFRWFDARLRRLLAEAGWPELTYSQSLVFAYLDGDGTRPAELARRIGVSRQAIHQTLGDLETMGLVRLEPDPSHGKAKLVRLTESGERNVEDALRIFSRIEDDVADLVGRADMATLRMALEADWGDP